MPNAYLYLRVSSDEQADSGLGIAAQRAACIRYCNNNNLALLGIYADEGVSGSTQLAERPQLAQLINKLKAGDVVVYLNRARLGRGVEVCMTIDAAIRAHKARHVSTAGEGTNHTQTATYYDTFVTQVSDAVGELERNRIRQLTRDALAVLRERGERYGNKPPIGWTYAPSQRTTHDGRAVYTLAPVAHEQAALEAVREARDCECGSSLSCISQQLAERGMFNRNGNPYSKSTIARMLKQLSNPIQLAA